jgi:hypothetical protein
MCALAASGASASCIPSVFFPTHPPGRLLGDTPKPPASGGLWLWEVGAAWWLCLIPWIPVASRVIVSYQLSGPHGCLMAPFKNESVGLREPVYRAVFGIGYRLVVGRPQPQCSAFSTERRGGGLLEAAPSIASRYAG